MWTTYVANKRPGQKLIWTGFLIGLLDISILFASAKWGENDMSLKALMLVALVVPMANKEMRTLVLLIVATVGMLIFTHKFGEISTG